MVLFADFELHQVGQHLDPTFAPALPRVVSSMLFGRACSIFLFVWAGEDFLDPCFK